MKPPLNVLIQSHARTCKGKRKYSCKGNAKKAIKRMKHPDKATMSAYLCACCGSWHMGHKKPRWKRAEEGKLR